MNENQIEYVFHDFKKEGVTAAKLLEWEKALGWETLLNKRGTTWRKIDPDTQARIIDGASARNLMMEHTSVIKRPVIESSAGIVVGFDENEYSKKFKS